MTDGRRPGRLNPELDGGLADHDHEEVFETPLDQGIERAVLVLRAAGVETFESCEGGSGHSYREPTVAFHGPPSEGFRAYAAALQHGLPIYDLRRVWCQQDGELTGPRWEMTFRGPVQ